MHGTHIVLWRGTTPPEYIGLKSEMRNSTLSNGPLEIRASEIISHSTPWLLDPCMEDIAPYGSLIFNTHMPFVGKPPGEKDVCQWQEHLLSGAPVLLLECPKLTKAKTKQKFHLYHEPGRSSGYLPTAVTPWIWTVPWSDQHSILVIFFKASHGHARLRHWRQEGKTIPSVSVPTETRCSF